MVQLWFYGSLLELANEKDLEWGRMQKTLFARKKDGRRAIGREGGREREGRKKLWGEFFQFGFAVMLRPILIY